MATAEERMKILDMVRDGKISRKKVHACWKRSRLVRKKGTNTRDPLP